MKRITGYFLLAVMFFACKKTDNKVFEKSASARTQATLDALGKTLTEAPNGWKAYLYPKGGAGFSYWIKFDNANRVKMVSDFDLTTAATLKSSSYRLKALQQPSLIFDTYSYIHLPADPDASISGGEYGKGLISDFEFFPQQGLIDSLKNNQGIINDMVLIGRNNNSTFRLVKATVAEEKAFNEKGLETLISNVENYFDTYGVLYYETADGNKVQLLIDTDDKKVSYMKLENSVLNTGSSVFAYTLNGFILKEPIVYNGQKIYEIIFDKANNQLYFIVDGKKIIIKTDTVPAIPLHHLLGGELVDEILLPNVTDFAGWSPNFKARRANADSLMFIGGYRLRLAEMLFRFNSAVKTMVLEVVITQDARRYRAVFNYNYALTGDGVYKFTKSPDGYAAANGGLIIKDMASILAQRIDTDQFKVEFYYDPVEGLLGRFKSIEHPDFYFSGYL